jgi:hypothetical protein
MNKVDQRAVVIAAVGAVIVIVAIFVGVHLINKSMSRDFSQRNTIPVWTNI